MPHSIPFGAGPRPGTPGTPGTSTYRPGTPGTSTYRPGTPGTSTHRPGTPGLPGTPGTSTHRTGTPSLAMAAVSAAVGREPGAPYLARRLRAEVRALAEGSERSVVDHLTCVLSGHGEEVRAGRVADALVQYACVLECEERLAEATGLLEMAATLTPDDPETLLRAGRVARRRGDLDGARTWYRAARSKAGSTPVGRLAEIGEALLAPAPEAELTRVLDAALGAGQDEAAAVALEERARLRSDAGDERGALADRLAATARHPAAADRAGALRRAAESARALGDEVGARRWGG